VLAGALALVYIFLAAQEAVVQKEINDLEYQIAQIDEEIVGVQVGVEQGQNIQLVRQKARDELGMSDPALEQNIYVNEIVVPEEGVARMIKDAAYGTS
jgi:cell division protein FtsB